MSKSLGFIGSIENHLGIENVRTLKKTISYWELEKIVNLYLYTLTSDIKTELESHIGYSDLSLTNSFIKKHFVGFKHKLLEFFINHE